VFGCAYEGLPTELAPLPHLIGANMSVRREAFEKLEGFHSIDFDDLDLCMRVATAYPSGVVLFEPRAIVHHYVPAERVAWRYFWRRCFFVNRDKVEAFAAMGPAANLNAEVTFVRRALTIQPKAALAGAARGHLRALVQLVVMLLGIGLAGLGNLAGQTNLAKRRSMEHRAEGHEELPTHQLSPGPIGHVPPTGSGEALLEPPTPTSQLNVVAQAPDELVVPIGELWPPSGPLPPA